MIDVPIGVVLEALVGVLLLVTIVYCIIVNRKLNALRADQEKFKDVIVALDRSTKKAEAMIVNFRLTVDETQKELDETIENAGDMSLRINEATKKAKTILTDLKQSPQGRTPAQGNPATGGRKASEKPARVKTDMRLSNLMKGAGAVKADTRPSSELSVDLSRAPRGRQR